MNRPTLTGAPSGAPPLPLEVALDTIETSGDPLLSDVLRELVARIEHLEDRIRFLERRPAGGDLDGAA